MVYRYTHTDGISRRQKGFTLIELLVVLGLLIILVATLILVIDPVKILRRARDDTRISQITELNKAIAVSIIDNMIVFPTTPQSVQNSCDLPNTNVDGTGWAGGWTGSIELYLPALPLDPVNSGFICHYFIMSQIDTWEINTVIESPDNAYVAINDGGNSGDSSTCDPVLIPNDACRYEVGPSLTLI